MGPADKAYEALRNKDDVAALRYFDEAKAQGSLSPSGHLDAGYTAKRLDQKLKAADYFEAGVDATGPDAAKMDEQQRFNYDREIAEMRRKWGFNGLIGYGPVGTIFAGSPVNTLSGNSTRNVGQLGGEVYVRPDAFGVPYANRVELFARYFATFKDEQGATTGAPTGQGALGLRWRPIPTQNLVLEYARLVKMGSLSRNDNLFRAAYSYDEGSDLRVQETQWLTWRTYAEIDRFTEANQTIAQFDARLGRSYRNNFLSENSVLFPHVLIAGNYDDSYATRTAYSAGIGLTQRIWFRNEGRTAPKSYVDLTVQYRARLSGDENRAKGLFLQASMAY